MTRGVRIRLLTFAVLAAVGIVYVAAAYLGVVDKVLGRGYAVAVDLPASGGLYVGSEVDYRGVRVGKVSSMQLTRDGARATLQLEDGTRIPRGAQVRVHNLSAVGEQYLDFLPTESTGPYLGDGDTLSAGAEALPETTDDLLTKVSGFADSVNAHDLQTFVKETGDMFRGNAANLRTLVDSSADLIDVASQHEDSTISLLDSGRQVLATQQAHAGDIRTFAAGLAGVTQALRASDPDLRSILQGGPTAIGQVQSLVEGLRPLFPLFITNLATVNQVFTARLPELEQTLVTFPMMAANGFVGTPGDGYGHLNMQLTYTTPVCTKGYMPPKDWIPGTQMNDPRPYFHARCTDPRAQPGYTGPDPINQRGANMAPPAASIDYPLRLGSYDARTGATDLGNGRTVTVTPGNGKGPLSVLESYAATISGAGASGAGAE
jgi:phospholipid/cholesterol/gamma-HCH transport system substrate-binding protein